MLPALRDLHANLAWLHDQIKPILLQLEPRAARLEALSPGEFDCPARRPHGRLRALLDRRGWSGRSPRVAIEGPRSPSPALAVRRSAPCSDEALVISERALERVAPADLERDYTTGPDGPVTVMGPLAHALEHTAIHTGHIELMRDLLVEGGAGD